MFDMGFGSLFKIRKNPHIIVDELPTYRHTQQESKRSQHFSLLSFQPWKTISKPKKQQAEQAIDDEYITIVPDEHRHKQEGQNRRVYSANPRIEIIQPATDCATKPKSYRLDPAVIHQRRSLCELEDTTIETNSAASRGRRHSRGRSEDHLLTTTITNHNQSARPRSGSQLAFVRSRRSPSRQRILRIDESLTPQKRRSSRSHSRTPSGHNLEHKSGRGRSSSRSHTTKYRVRRSDARTPSPLPELDGNSISPVSLGPETPMQYKPRTRSCYGKEVVINVQVPFINIAKLSNEVEPEVYDEFKHSPEDFYKASFSPIRHEFILDAQPSKKLDSDPVGDYEPLPLATPDRPGLSRLSIPNKSNYFSNPASVHPEDGRSTLAPPTFSLSPGITTQENHLNFPDNSMPLSPISPSSVRSPTRLQNSPEMSEINVSPLVPSKEPTIFELPSDSLEPSRPHRAHRPVSKLVHPIPCELPTPANDPQGTGHLELKQKMQQHSLQNFDNPARLNSSRTEASDHLTVKPAASYERLRPSPSPHRRIRSEANTPNERSRTKTSYSYTPTRDMRADRKSYNTVRFLDSSGESHEKLRKVLGI